MATRSLSWQSKDAFEGARIAIAKRREWLLVNHPDEIVSRYRSGSSLSEMAEDYFPKDNIISPNIPRNAVLSALHELLSPEEKKRLGLKHKREAYKKRKDFNLAIKKTKHPKRVAAGKRSYKVGLSKITSEQLAKTCIERMVQNGIFPYEGEVRFVNTGLNSQQLLYPMNEKEYVLYLREQGAMIWGDIEDRVNYEFNTPGRNPRKANSIRVVYQGWKKKSSSN